MGNHSRRDTLKTLGAAAAASVAPGLLLPVRAHAAFDAKPDFSTGVGVGVRWYSPLGPLRLDLAHPLDDPDRNLRVHISLGTDL